MKKILLGSDHAGFKLKEEIKAFLTKRGIACEDLGTDSEERANWSLYGARVAAAVSADPVEKNGILVCGSGIGMSIVANRFRHVRAALCHNEYTAEMSRAHNNSNILCLGARILGVEEALKIVGRWLETDFEGGHHQERLDYLDQNVDNRSS